MLVKEASFIFFLLYFPFWRSTCRFLPLLKLRTHWRLSTILEASNKSAWSNVFWYAKVCIFWKCIQYTIHRNKTNLKKIPFRQNKRYKKCPHFSFASRNSSQFYFEFAILVWAEARKVCLSKTVWDFPFSISFRFY